MSEPSHEKLVWQGEYEGMKVRVRIVRYDDPDGSPVYTELHQANAEGGWDGVAFWHEPNANAIARESMDRLAFMAFIECMIDLMGRPEWDMRKPTTSVFPPRLLLADANGQVIPQMSATIPVPSSDR